MKAHGALNVLIHAALLVVLGYVLAATLALANPTRFPVLRWAWESLSVPWSMPGRL